jgi:hypothetical protein
MSLSLDLLNDLMPSFLAFSTAVTTYYNNKKNVITFYMSVFKVIMVSSSFLYLLYLFYFKNQQKVESSLRMALIQNSLTLIFAFSSVYFIYKELINKQVSTIAANVTEVTSNIATNVTEVTSNIATNIGISESTTTTK